MLIVSFLLMALYVFYTYSGATAMTQFCVASPCDEAIAIRAVRSQFLVFRRGRPIGVVIEVIEATYIADVEESAQARTAGNRFHLVAPRRLIGLAEERYLVAIVGLPHRIPLEAARAAELAWYPLHQFVQRAQPLQAPDARVFLQRPHVVHEREGDLFRHFEGDRRPVGVRRFHRGLCRKPARRGCPSRRRRLRRSAASDVVGHRTRSRIARPVLAILVLHGGEQRS